MIPELQIDRIINCTNWLEEMAEEMPEVQSIKWYMDNINMMCKALAFVNGQMALAKKILNERKVKAYETLVASSAANEQYFAPSLAKDYIAAKCSVEQYNYD